MFWGKSLLGMCEKMPLKVTDTLIKQSKYKKVNNVKYSPQL